MARVIILEREWYPVACPSTDPSDIEYAGNKRFAKVDVDPITISRWEEAQLAFDRYQSELFELIQNNEGD